MKRPKQIKEDELARAIESLRLSGSLTVETGRGRSPAAEVASMVFDVVEYQRRQKVGLTT